MGIDRRELKRRARQAMALPRPRFYWVTLAYILMTSGVSILFSLIPLPAGSDYAPSSVTIFLSLLLSLYAAVVSFGYTLWALWTYRRLNPGLGSLIQGFSVSGRVILMRLAILARLAALSLLLGLGLFLLALFPPLLPPAILACGAIFLSVLLRYALAPYLLADHPDDGSGAALRRSVQLMQGWRWELFKLELSFWGWVALRWLLIALATGAALWHSGLPEVIHTLSPDQLLVSLYVVANSLMAFALSTLLTLPLDLWLSPYQEVARAAFYDARLQAQRQEPPPFLL